MSDVDRTGQPSTSADESVAPAEASTPTIPGSSAQEQLLDQNQPEGVATEIAPPMNGQDRPKTKGVADIVFLIDVTGSMAPCIDALRRNIEAFIDSLSNGEANNSAPVKDWRGKVVGYRDIEAASTEGLPWIVNNDFVRDASALKAQLGSLQANGGGDEPESLLDALYQVAAMEAVPKGSQTENPAKWRYRSDAARVVIVFTDASFKETMSIPEAKGGSLQDVANVVMANRIILSLLPLTSRDMIG